MQIKPLDLLKTLSSGSSIYILCSSRVSPKRIRKVVDCYKRQYRVSVYIDSKDENNFSDHSPDIKVASIYECLNSDNQIQSVRAASDIAGTWYNHPKIKKELKWQSINIGAMLEGMLPDFCLIDIVKSVEAVKRIIAEGQPDGVILVDFDEPFRIVLEELCKRHPTPYEVVTTGRLSNCISKIRQQIAFKILSLLLDVRDIVVRILWAKLIYQILSPSIQNSKKGSSQRKAVFVGFTRNHFTHILPVAEHLETQGWRIHVVRGLLGSTFLASGGLKVSRWPILPVDGYVSMLIFLKYLRAKWAMRRTWKRITKDNRVDELFLYNGVNLWPLMKNHLRYCFYVYLPNTTRYFDLTLRMIEKESPDILVFGDDIGHAAHAMVAASSQRRVNTAVMQHGIAADPWDYRPCCNYILAWGSKSRETLIDWGVSAEKILCIGAPGLDELILLHMDKARLNKMRVSVCEQLSINQTKKCILFLPSKIQGQTPAQAILMSFNAIKKLHLEDRFIVKLHPEDDGNVERGIATSMHLNPLIVKDVNIWGLIAASTVVITTLNSTAGLEALILGKPVIAIKSIEALNIYDKTPGLVSEVTTENELKERIVEMINGQGHVDVELLGEFIGIPDGKAKIRAANAIVSIYMCHRSTARRGHC